MRLDLKLLISAHTISPCSHADAFKPNLNNFFVEGLVVVVVVRIDCSDQLSLSS